MGQQPAPNTMRNKKTSVPGNGMTNDQVGELRQLDGVQNPRAQATVSAAVKAALRGWLGTGACMSLGMLICCPPALAGGPTGGRITSGNGTISQNGGSTLIDQQSENLAINWTSFSIGSGDSVRFAQPDSSAIALNRVVGQDPSTILGSLRANGQVFILNPNGVLFGKTAQVNVGALAASTLNLSDADFQSGHYQFTAGGGKSGTVLNLGRLKAAPGGYLALLGPKVVNQGNMSVVGGTVLLAAGNKVSLHLDNGSLLSYSIDRGALNALAENDSLIQAAGGRVYMTAMAADSVAKAVVNNKGVIEAQTVENQGGVIRLLGDPSNGQVNVGGTLDASAPNGGDGGAIETSASQVQVAADARITTTAAAGKTGSWLVDPTDFTIAPSGGDITGATLGSELGSTNVTLSSSQGGKSGTGAMNVDDTVSWSANHTLTLNASGNIYINSNITATGNTAGLALNYGSGGNYYVNGAKVTLSGSSPTLSIGGQSYTVINSLGVEGDTSKTTLQGMNGDLSGHYALGSDLDASATSGWKGIQGLVGLMPIGSLSTPFTGQFAGLGHVISNLTVNYQNNSEIGLFGETGTGSVIRDVGLNGGTVVGTDYVGSLVGINQGTVLDSYSNLSMNDQHYLGGLVGENNGTISGSYDTGTVISKNKIVGGLVGLNNGTISDSYATGTITAPNKMIGGLVGENGGSIVDSYAAGKVGGTSQQIGGLVGYGVGTTGIHGTVTNSFWDTTTSGQSASAGGTGMTTANMRTQANFTSATSANGNVNPNWDFNGVWTINNGSSYPLLKGFLQQITVTADNVSWTYTSSPWNGSDGYSCSNGNCSGLTGTIAFGGTAVGAINVGTYSIIPGGLTSNQYAISFVPGQLTISPALLAITGLTANGKVYDGTQAAALSGTATVNPFGSDSSRLTLGGTGTGLFASKNVGTNVPVTVSGYTLSGAAAGNYTLVEPTLTASITPYQLAISGVTAANKVYDATTVATLNGTAKVSAFSGDNVALAGSGTGTFASKNVGTQAVTLTGFTLQGSDAGNYTLLEPSLTASITPYQLAVSGLTASNKVYDSTTAATLSGTAKVTGLTGDSVALQGTGTGTFASKDAGTGKAVTVSGFTLTGADSSNYTLVEPAGLTATITPAPLVVRGLTANTKVYDGTTAATYAGTPTVATFSGDNVSVGGTGTATFSSKNAGSEPVSVTGFTLTGTDAGDYALIPTTLAGSITPAPLAIAGLTAENKVYDATTAATLGGAAKITPISGDDVALSGSGTGTFASKNVGTQAVTVSGFSLTGTDAGNYTLAQPTGLTASITPYQLAIAGLSADNKTYDGTTTATLSGTAKVTAFANDSVALEGTGNGTFASKNVGTQAVTVSGFTLSGADSSNYTLLEPTLTATITPFQLTVSGITAENKVYDATTAATLSGAAKVSGFSGDSVALGGTGTGTFASKNVGTQAVTVTGFTLTGADASNYTLAQPTGLSASITPKSLTVTGLSAIGKVYDATTAAALSGTAKVSAFSGDSVALGGTGTGTFASKNVGTQVVTVTGFSLTGTDAGNYTLQEPTGLAASITPYQLAVSGVTAQDKVYDATTAATLSGTAKVSAFSGDDVALGGTGTGTFASKNVGTQAVTVTGFTLTGTDAGNYTLQEPTGLAASITPYQLAVSGVTAQGKVYDATTAATLSGTAKVSAFSGDDVALGGTGTGTFASKNVGTQTVSVNGFTLTGTDAGNYTLQEPVGLTASITPAPLAVTGLTAQSRVYDATTDASLSGSATISRLGQDDVALNGSATGSFGDKNVGTNKAVTVSGLTLSGTDAGNYTLVAPSNLTANITPASLSVGGLVADDKVYDGTTTASLTGFAAVFALGNDIVNLNGTGTATFASKNVGSQAVTVGGFTISGADAGNYTLSQPEGLSANITPAPLAISGLSALNKVYDATTTAALSGTAKVNAFTGDSVALGGAGTATFASKNAGTEAVTVGGFTLTGADAGNYTLVEPTGLTASITPAQLLISGLTASGKVYDATTTAALSGTAKISALGQDNVVLNGSATGAFADKNVGSNKTVTVSGLTLIGADAGNYALVEPAGLTASITPAELNLSGISASNRVYDATVTAGLSGTPTVTALGNDAVRVSGTGVGTFGDKNVGSNKAVTVGGYSLTGTDAGNYVLVEPTGLTANITAAPLAITGLTAQNKVYDATTTATLSGTAAVKALGNDKIALGGTGTAVFASKNVGTGEAVTVSGYTLGGTDAGNYTLTEPTGLTASITPAPLAITGLTAQNKVYDATTAAALTGSATVAPLANDNVSVGGAGVGTFGDKNVGDNKAVSVSGFTLTGSDAGNYTLVEPTGLSASITPADLILGGISASNKVYDASVAATLTGAPTVAALGKDAVSVGGTGVGTFGDKNAGNNKAVTVSGYSLTGTDAGNYVLVEPTGLTANITPAPLVITGVTTSNKVYDGTATAALSGGAAISAISGDNVALSGTGSGAFADKNAGTNKTVTVSGYSLTGTDAGNYALIEPTDLTASITPRPLTVSATGTSRTYDGLTDAAVALSDNRVSGDTLTTGFASAAFADPNAGTGKTITVSGITLGGVDAGNYTFNTTASATADITPAPLTITADSATKTYSGATFRGGDGVTYSGFVNDETASVLGGTLSYGGTSQRGSNVGTYSIIPAGLTSSNYAITFVGGTLQVTPAPLTVTANDDTVTFSGTPFSGGNGVTYSGFVANQGAGILGGALTYGGTSQGAVDAGTYTIVPGGLTSTNYAITFDAGTLTISPAAAAAMASAVSQSDTGAFVATSDSSSNDLVTMAANAAP